MAARWTGQVSRFGAMLDSWADVITYVTVAICCWWLWPAIVQQELIYFSMIIASCLFPAMVGLEKFGSFTSYHTWSVKIAAAATGISLYILFFNGPVWPFRIAAALSIWAACEEIAITLLLPQPEPDVRSIWKVIKVVKDKKS